MWIFTSCIYSHSHIIQRYIYLYQMKYMTLLSTQMKIKTYFSLNRHWLLYICVIVCRRYMFFTQQIYRWFVYTRYAQCWGEQWIFQSSPTCIFANTARRVVWVHKNFITSMNPWITITERRRTKNTQHIQRKQSTESIIGKIVKIIIIYRQSEITKLRWL